MLDKPRFNSYEELRAYKANLRAEMDVAAQELDRSFDSLRQVKAHEVLAETARKMLPWFGVVGINLAASLLSSRQEYAAQGRKHGPWRDMIKTGVDLLLDYFEASGQEASADDLEVVADQ